MKQLLHGLFVAAAIVCCSFQQVFAQQLPPVPVDPNVRIGKLDNGLTYYIRKNALPANRADFYIAQKVGSIQEEESQRGLAHFLEHMCFNGTTHFPGDALKQYLEHIGVKFGENLNAYTSVDETVYNISNVPVTMPGAIDSCLLILHDWSNDLTLDPKEIDKERGVINEEWRTRMSAMQRMQEKMLPQMFAGTKYATCFPIGTMDVVMNFKYQTLRDYYEKWYRPDLQGIVVVGDIDVDAVEAKIKTMFADIPAQPDAAERIYYPVNDNKEPIIIIEQDKEQPHIQVLVFNKHDATPDDQKGNMGYLVQNYATNLISSMLNARLNELTQTANPPFIYAGTFEGDFFVAKTKDAFTGVVVCKEGTVEDGIANLLREMERARQFGFTETEYNRARAEYLRQLESAYNERDKRKNEEYVNEYVRHFLDKEPIPGIEVEYTLLNKLAPNIPVEAVNQIMQQLITDNNQVVLLAGPEKEGAKYPTKEEIAALLKQMKSFDLKPYEDKVSNEPLISEDIKGGKIVSEKAGEIYGTTKLVLSNGVTVYVKPTDFKADQIVMKGVSFGGTSVFPNEEIINISQLNGVALVGGIGNFSKVDLGKALAGKRANVGAGIGNTTETVSGSCAPKDFETMMQLTYLTFTSPRKDNEAFESYKNRLKAELQNADANPMTAFSDTITSVLYGHHPRAIRMKENMVDQINYDRILEMYKDRYKDASDFTFFLVGNVDLATMKPLIAKYLGGLPSINRKETFKDNKMDIRKGEIKNVFAKAQETPMATIMFLYSGTCKYDLRNNVLLSFLDQALDLVYTAEIREKEGGTYGVSCNGSLGKYPKEELVLQIVFQTDPAKKDKLSAVVVEQLHKMAKEGPSAEHMQKIKEYMLKPISATELSDSLVKLKNTLDKEREEKLKEIYEGLEEIKDQLTALIDEYEEEETHTGKADELIEALDALEDASETIEDVLED